MSGKKRFKKKSKNEGIKEEDKKENNEIIKDIKDNDKIIKEIVDIKKESNKITEIKDSIDLSGAPTLRLNNIYFNCSECPSTIEILSLNEQEIEFKCNNKHHVKTPISDYINKMKKYNTLKLNYNICNMHNKEYSSYCFDCNIHLCKDCIKSREHSYHYKIYLFEIIPTNKVLNDFENLINENKNFIINLNNEKIIKENKLKIILNNNINKINKKKYKEKKIMKIK